MAPSFPLRERYWREFVSWCRTRRVRSLPAHPWVVASYLLWCEANRRRRSIDARLEVLSRSHMLRGRQDPCHHPLVLRTREAIETRRHLPTHRSVFDGIPVINADGNVALDAAVLPEEVSSKVRRLANEPKLVSRRPGN